MATQTQKRDRPTIGILAGWSAHEGTEPDHYLSSILRGIQSAAQIKKSHLLLAWGVGRVTEASEIYPAWPEISPESDFVPVGPWNTDGLIVFTPLRNEGRSLYIQQLRAEGHPVLFIAAGENGPTVAADSREGIRQAMFHLLEHGHRRIAFIAGTSSDKGDSEDRLCTYHTIVTQHDLDADPRLVARGEHTLPGGYKAMREILSSGVEPTAVMASNDSSAFGAMQAIQVAGLQIPRDIAIIGFDDLPDAAAQVPPLTSVHVPLVKIGEQALVLMLDHLTMQTPLESVRIPVRLVPRPSCGCIPETVLSAASGESRVKTRMSPRSKACASNLPELEKQLVNEMVAVLPAEIRVLDEDRTRHHCATLVKAFFASLENDEPFRFQSALMEFLQEMELVDANMDPWQEIVSVLRREMACLPAGLKQAKTRRLAEDLLHQARTAISESVQRQDYRHRHQRATTAQILSVLTARLSTVLDERQAAELLTKHLPSVGIRHARIVLFEPQSGDAAAWSTALYAAPELPTRRFPSRQFPPPGLYPPDELLNIALLPLVFQNEALGYVAFDASDLEPCAAIARQLAATLKTSRLHAQVVELSLTDALTGLYNRRFFDLVLNNEVERGRRFNRELAIIMLDIDNFKDYNDTFGHPAGDVALQSVADCLRDGRRDADIVTRIGGDEFALILPETGAKGALQVAKKISTKLATLSDLERPLTISMGISVLRETGHETSRLVQQADLALYEAKRTGRNRALVFQGNKQAIEWPNPEQDPDE
jgi:diguanylate cyclase (GGDEF)-like protein